MTSAVDLLYNIMIICVHHHRSKLLMLIEVPRLSPIIGVMGLRVANRTAASDIVDILLRVKSKRKIAVTGTIHKIIVFKCSKRA